MSSRWKRNYCLQSSGGIYMQAPTLNVFRSTLSLVSSAARYPHLSYWLNVKLKFFELRAPKRLRTLLLVGSASALLPLFKAFTVIDDRVNPSLACLPQCKPGCNHPFSCSSHPASPGCQHAVPWGGQRWLTPRPPIWLPSPNVFQRLSVFAHTHVMLWLCQNPKRVFLCLLNLKCSICWTNIYSCRWTNNAQSVGTHVNLDNEELTSAVCNRNASKRTRHLFTCF